MIIYLNTACPFVEMHKEQSKIVLALCAQSKWDDDMGEPDLPYPGAPRKPEPSLGQLLRIEFGSTFGETPRLTPLLSTGKDAMGFNLYELPFKKGDYWRLMADTWIKGHGPGTFFIELSDGDGELPPYLEITYAHKQQLDMKEAAFRKELLTEGEDFDPLIRIDFRPYLAAALKRDTEQSAQAPS